MKEQFVDSRRWGDEAGRTMESRYYITIEPVEVGDFVFENYGVHITRDDGTEAVVSGVTASAARIEELIQLLIRNEVGPDSAAYVIADWL